MDLVSVAHVAIKKAAVSSTLAIALALLLVLPSAALVPEIVYTVEVEGQKRDLIELIEVKHCGSRHHWWQVWASIEDYHVYRVYGDEQHVILNPHQFKTVKKSVAEVPDNRAYETKYPLRTEFQHDLNTGLGIGITLIQLVK